MGLLYSYVCLISYESDCSIASEEYLLPRELSESPSGWEKYNPSPFLHAVLRLARLNTLYRLQMPLFEPYLRHYWTYGSLFHDNIMLLATATVFVALVLVPMQVGLATEQLGQNKSFIAASYGLTVFAILGPLYAFALMVLNVL
ncbi:hypothetical protein BDV26DRAFT_291816 [Aspergillus bertholletiae]|uniref:Uncharacterized protein n=1 Tax=Aspergillus bertholletiae TaxID=1226010 RepID=A0A5N7BAQ2_9EURO|nr:hypothetical protein BDV26DRAFT_291816 [Aspergillus bertholletiae]